MKIALLSVLTVMTQFLACPDRPVACTAIFVSGVNVSLTNIQTGAPISGATLTLTEGSYNETLQELQPGQYTGAGERAGTYSLIVATDGFGTETRDNIFVDADQCHVIPVTLDITMTPN